MDSRGEAKGAGAAAEVHDPQMLSHRLALLRRLQQHKPKIPPAYRYALGGAEMERLMRTFSLVFSKRGTGASFPWRLLKKRRFCDTIITISRAFAEATEKPGGNKNEQ